MHAWSELLEPETLLLLAEVVVDSEELREHRLPDPFENLVLGGEAELVPLHLVGTVERPHDVREVVHELQSLAELGLAVNAELASPPLEAYEIGAGVLLLLLVALRLGHPEVVLDLRERVAVLLDGPTHLSGVDGDAVVVRARGGPVGEPVHLQLV